MKTTFLRSIPMFLFFILLFSHSSVHAVEPVYPPGDNAPLLSSEDFLFTPDKDFEKRLNWREKIALKILKKRLKKRLKKGPGNFAFPFSQPSNDGCVTIVLNNGQRFFVEIVRMTETELVCRNCGNKKGEEMVVPWEKVLNVEGGVEMSALVKEANRYRQRVNEGVDEGADCIWLVLKNKQRLKVQILQMNEKEINYKKCDDNEGGEITVPWKIVKDVKGTQETADVVLQAKRYIFGEPREMPDYSNYEGCVWINLTSTQNRQKVRIVQVTDTSIIYRKCGDLNSQEISANKSSVEEIWVKEKALRYENRNYFSDDSQVKKVEGVGVIAFLTTALAWILARTFLSGPFVIVLFIVGFILSIVGIIRHFVNPKKYNGLGIILALLGALLGLRVILAVLPYFF